MDWCAYHILLLFIILAYDKHYAFETQDWHEQMEVRFNFLKVSFVINIASKMIKVWMVCLSSEVIGRAIHRAVYFKKIMQTTCSELTLSLQRKPCSHNGIILPAISPFFIVCHEIQQVFWIHHALTNNNNKNPVINLWLTINLKQNVETIRCFWMSVVYDRRSLTVNPYKCQGPKAMK